MVKRKPAYFPDDFYERVNATYFIIGVPPGLAKHFHSD
jgi:hypothetical protein